MIIMGKPHFVIKNKFQKRTETYKDILTEEILTEVCNKITGKRKYSVNFIDAVNIGRQATLEYQGSIYYISFSENRIGGRNASLQSFPSALVNFHKEENPNKKIYFYILPTVGNFETRYFIFMYRLMKTAGAIFLNEGESINTRIFPFSTVQDIILNKNSIRSKNSSNNSTYITRNQRNVLQIFGKTYGASKYETTLLCLAISKIAVSNIELYEIEEGNLKKLPKKAREVINALDKVTIVTSNITLEKREYETNNSLRSPSYIYNLLEKLGDKKCAFCECKIPQIIEGAHIWAVADIKKENQLTLDEKLSLALDGDNGLWLCQNHHKLLDVHILRISENGLLKYQTAINKSASNYIKSITTNHQVTTDFITSGFLKYLRKRNETVSEELFSKIP